MYFWMIVTPPTAQPWRRTKLLTQNLRHKQTDRGLSLPCAGKECRCPLCLSPVRGRKEGSNPSAIWLTRVKVRGTWLASQRCPRQADQDELHKALFDMHLGRWSNEYAKQRNRRQYRTDPVLDLPDALSAMATVSKDGHTFHPRLTQSLPGRVRLLHTTVSIRSAHSICELSHHVPLTRHRPVYGEAELLFQRLGFMWSQCTHYSNSVSGRIIENGCRITHPLNAEH